MEALLDQFSMRLDQLKGNYQQRLGELNIIESNIASLTQEINISRAKQEHNSKISSVLQKAAELSRDHTKQHLEQVCTMALQYVFGKDLEFVIDMVDSRGVANAEFYLQYIDGKDTIRVKPEDSVGGGVIDVMSTALRFAFLELLNDPIIQSPVILDEPGKMVSEQASMKMAMLIKELNKSFGRQIIMSTHNIAYASVADKDFEVTQSGVYSKVVEKTSVINVLQNLTVEEHIDIDGGEINV